MEHTRLGRTDLEVSRVALGCMSYGNPGTGLHQWTLDEEASQPFFRQAVELGVTFWDTANTYQAGSSEEDRGVPMAQIALAWVLRNPVVTAPIVGATKEKHLADAVAALDVTLSEDEASALEAPYQPQSPYWY